ncbi:MipA/OmpV family protein [Sagittula sp. NFXS13]|uniref:MipA/OmpV family protein n=1 Tax=Sagittula sp. NFXS13 TaxID=2819095 RepID=UPI0032DEF48C
MRLPLCLTVAALTVATPALAQDRALAFELGLGARVSPDYEGSEDYSTGPSVTGAVRSLNLLGLNIDRGDGLGFGFGPSFRYIGERTEDDHSRLAGIDDVDAAFEVGGRVSYRWEKVEVWGAVRKGVTGHDGVTGNIGSDFVHDYGQGTEVRVGPRLAFANDEYMDTYFNVPAGASLAEYSGDGGLYKAGLEMVVRHDYNDAWAVEGSLGWNRLVGDAGDSPIVEERDSGTVGIMLIRKFDWAF